mmetsp:Transcript_40586/g.99665  ORF Transcript_40586/g.99665 Transcript_40586/m.99665 type:complete len:260 (-) Transcript_40586:286-1065(-)
MLSEVEEESEGPARLGSHDFPRFDHLDGSLPHRCVLIAQPIHDVGDGAGVVPLEHVLERVQHRAPRQRTPVVHLVLKTPQHVGVALFQHHQSAHCGPANRGVAVLQTVQDPVGELQVRLCWSHDGRDGLETRRPHACVRIRDPVAEDGQYGLFRLWCERFQPHHARLPDFRRGVVSLPTHCAQPTCVPLLQQRRQGRARVRAHIAIFVVEPVHKQSRSAIRHRLPTVKLDLDPIFDVLQLSGQALRAGHAHAKRSKVFL